MRGSGALARGRRLAVVLLLAGASSLAPAAPAWAATPFPFAILIEDGVDFEQFDDSSGLMVGFRSGNRTIYSVVNGQKTATILGTATIVVWSRTVPDPFFGVFGPLAGLGILHLGAPYNLHVHLGLFQDAAGAFQTTIAAFQAPGPSYQVDPTVRGAWVIANGTDVGGDANDLVIGGLWLTGPASPAGGAAVSLDMYFPTVPFASDPKPTSLHCIDPFCIRSLASFYGQGVYDGKPRPFRSFTIREQGAIPDIHAHLMVGDLGAGDYVVVACSGAVNVSNCTLSGVGPHAGSVTGSANYSDAGLSTNLNAILFAVP